MLKEVAPHLVRARSRRSFCSDDNSLQALAEPIVTRALAQRVPTFANLGDTFAQAAPCSTIPAIRRKRSKASRLLKKILGGAAPGELPIEQPTRFNLFNQSEDGEEPRYRAIADLIARADKVFSSATASPTAARRQFGVEPRTPSRSASAIARYRGSSPSQIDETG